MNKDRELNRLVRSSGLRRADRKVVAQYSECIDEGVRIAARTVAKRLFAAGWGDAEVGALLNGLLPADELTELIDEAKD